MLVQTGVRAVPPGIIQVSRRPIRPGSRRPYPLVNLSGPAIPLMIACRSHQAGPLDWPMAPAARSGGAAPLPPRRCAPPGRDRSQSPRSPGENGLAQ